MKKRTYVKYYTDIKSVNSITINDNVVNSGNDTIIDVSQTSAELKNEFEIYYNGKKQMSASLPFLSFSVYGFFGLNKVQQMKIYDLNGNIKYTSSYNYIKNRVEEIIPLKFLVTGDQKFDQFTFKNQNDFSEINIYKEAKTLSFDRLIMKVNSEYYQCYEVEDGNIFHIIVYDNDKQIAELLKPNVVIDEKDQYRIYLKEKYEFLSDALSILALYTDRLKYNSSFLYNRSEYAKYSKTHSDVNKYYDPNWVKNNFKVGSYFEDIEKYYSTIKTNVTKQQKRIFLMIVCFSVVALIIVLIILKVFN